MRGRALNAVALAALVALIGCGGSSGSPSSANRVEAVVHRWQAAVAARNVGEACALMDAKGQAMLRRELAGFIAAHATGSSCPALIAFLHDGVMTRSQWAEFAAGKPVAVTISGEEAKARTGGSNFWLTRSDGQWRISEIPLAG